MDRGNPAITRHVRDVWPNDQLAELIESAEAVELTLASPGYQAVKRILDAELATIDAALDDGPAKDAADYAKQHGRRGALRSFDEAARAIVGEAQRRREKAEQEIRDSAEPESRERTAA